MFEAILLINMVNSLVAPSLALHTETYTIYICVRIFYNNKFCFNSVFYVQYRIVEIRIPYSVLMHGQKVQQQ